MATHTSSSWQPSQWVDAIDSSGIRRVFDLGAKLKNPINMSIGQPHFDAPVWIKKAAQDAVLAGKNTYTPTQGLAELIEKLKEHVHETRGKSPEDLFITSGVSGGLYLAYMSMLGPGDEIIIPDPYFVMYESLPKLAGAIPIRVDLYPDFTYTREKLEAAITSRTKAIMLNSPSNPTGKVLSQREIDMVVDLAKQHDLFIISDEIYDRFVYDLDGYLPSPFTKYEKTVLLSGFSKSYSVTGWRVGYVAGPEEVLQQMKKLQQYTFVCAPAPFQYALLSGFSQETDQFIQKHVDGYRKKRDFLYESLQSKFKLSPSEGAFYAFTEVPGGDGDAFMEKSIENNCLIVNGSVFSKQKSHVRISFACDDETLKTGVGVLNSLV